MVTKKVRIFDNGQDRGYLGNNQTWWFDPAFDDSFTIFDLNSFYPGDYFAEDHVNSESVERCTGYMLDYCSNILGRRVASILELGAGGGWFTREFMKRGIDFIAVEGTHAGIKRALENGIPGDGLIQHDLRLRLNLQRRFDLVVCTEMAEHIEPPFSSQLVTNIIEHTDLVWFSFEPPSTNESHYHHCNEQPEKFWRNLFAFYGFDIIRLPENIVDEVLANRGGYIFYNGSRFPQIYRSAHGEEQEWHGSHGDTQKRQSLPHLSSIANGLRRWARKLRS
jgi:hypothetical protein